MADEGPQLGEGSRWGGSPRYSAHSTAPIRRDHHLRKGDLDGDQLRGRGRGSPQPVRPCGGRASSAHPPPEAALAARGRGRLGSGVQGLGARRLRAGGAGDIGAPARAPGQVLQRACRSVAATRRRHSVQRSTGSTRFRSISCCPRTATARSHAPNTPRPEPRSISPASTGSMAPQPKC